MLINKFCFVLLIAFAALTVAADKKPWKDGSISVGDIKVHYIEAGAGDHTLVFLPGWTMTAEVWKEQIPYFASRNFRVIAMDPRGQGQTTKTEQGNTYFQHAADLVAFLKALKLDRQQTTLVGWSAAVDTLLEYVSSPETGQPEHLVFVDGGPMFRKETDYPWGVTIQQGRTMALGFEDDRAKAADRFVRGMFKATQAELLYKELADASMKTPTGTAVALFFDFFSGDRRQALSRIMAPTLIVVADGNRAMGEFMQSKIGGSQLEVVPDSGHALFLEKPQAFNQVLEGFLAKY
jgi:pimeloyl-ACP methyl ester carboxylesterase